MGDQVSSLQRMGIAANLLQPFYRLYRVESSRRLIKDFWEQRIFSAVRYEPRVWGGGGA